MAGRGPLPKDPSKLAGHGRAKARSQQMKVIMIEPVPQPALPKERPGGLPWPKLTREWWARWAEEPMAREFSGPDWAFLMDTALLHAAVWADGEVKLLGELRLRTAKYGVTPEDRARLRIQYSSADAAEERLEQSGAGARARRGQIRALKPDEITGEPEG
ncbi:phage terminase small subunit [Brachybacterium alimentarium]|uniref:phage terminase small subunit n=1 Tax=Brachybacterium alimentarium TaxID=47845 RepID=UPI000DF381FA|nr:hypothetical protein CIK68_09150 [Brachybacterium alimentarium]